MSIRVAISHHTTYRYDRLVELSPHLIRLRPASHCRTPIHSYSLKVAPKNHFVNWQQDPFGNHIARFVFPEKMRELSIQVELIAEMTVINPFDFFAEEYAEYWPFTYEPELAHDLTPYLKVEEKGPELQKFLSTIDVSKQRIVDFLVKANQLLQRQIRYNIRMESGVQTCEETLKLGSGSCRDTGWLLVQILRNLGLAARFVSGYLIQLVSDVKSLDGASGPEADFTDLHAWAEVYVPGAGWIGLDPTSGLFAGEGHIPLCCTPNPASAAPISGFADECETEFRFSNRVTRIHEDPRVTKPYSEAQWQAIMALGDSIDVRLAAQDVRLTQGGEPTFVSIDDYDADQWNTTALGEHKERLARDLLRRLSDSFARNPVLHHGQGKWYPGEELPRWAYSCFFRADGAALWNNRALLSPVDPPQATLADARRFSTALAQRLGVPALALAPAYENAAYYLGYEASLPKDIDPYEADLKDSLERRRLARILNRGIDEATGFVLPVQWHETRNRWHSAPWPLRSGKIILLPGDSPLGYRLPLDSLPWKSRKKRQQIERDPFEERTPLSHLQVRDSPQFEPPQTIAAQEASEEFEDIPHTAICVEPRDGRLWVFLPPLTHLEHWLALIRAVEDTAESCHLAVDLEGYAAPQDPRLKKIAITPDPGVIEVNIHPSENWPSLASSTETLYEQARRARLGTEKFMLDGRHTGTGGGNHITLGGQSPADSPFLRRPDLLASLLVFWQNHPSLSYLFSGLFIGPTSQAPRIDEARDDALYELEIALQQIEKEQPAEPWRVDRLFRNLLVDITGNTHRAEFCIDKLYSPSGPAGRLGLVEMRAFEMPPHWQMSLAQSLLLRALVACFWHRPYREKPVHWGNALHDRFMLPHYVKLDFADVIDYLNHEGFAFDLAWYAPFFEFRFPHYGTIERNGMSLSVHLAIEPWHVLGEEVTAHGTSRFVDSSVERMQVSVKNFNAERYCLTCNGRKVPLQATDITGEFVAGIRYKAWQPPFGLHPLLPVDVPLVFDLVDLLNRKSIGGCTYHVDNPSGKNYETLPVNANEAEARRIARFWDHGHTQGKIVPADNEINRLFPCTLDLRKS